MVGPNGGHRAVDGIGGFFPQGGLAEKIRFLCNRRNSPDLPDLTGMGALTKGFLKDGPRSHQ